MVGGEESHNVSVSRLTRSSVCLIAFRQRDTAIQPAAITQNTKPGLLFSVPWGNLFIYSYRVLLFSCSFISLSLFTRSSHFSCFYTKQILYINL